MTSCLSLTNSTEEVSIRKLLFSEAVIAVNVWGGACPTEIGDFGKPIWCKLSRYAPYPDDVDHSLALSIEVPSAHSLKVVMS